MIYRSLADISELIRQHHVSPVDLVNECLDNIERLNPMSIPCGFSTRGMPLGLQIVGPRWGEGIILDIAHRFQEATNWHVQHPKVA